MIRDRADPGHGGLRLEEVSLELGGQQVLEGIDLDLEPGHPVVLTGPSGSGKTVLCLVLAGILRATRGRVRGAGGSPTEGASTVVGLVLQTPGLAAHLTAHENVALPLQARRGDPLERRRRSISALGAVGLADQADRLVDDLSGGERQRVGIARAIAGDPHILIADEPTSELDPVNRDRVMELLVGEQAPRRIVVVACDDPEVHSRFARVVRLEQGRIVEVSTR